MVPTHVRRALLALSSALLSMGAVAAISMPAVAFADGPQRAVAAAPTAQAAPTYVEHGDGYTETNTGASQSVTFIDDPVGADGASPNGALLVVRPSAARVGLVTPRSSFVPEMLKSVEQL